MLYIGRIVAGVAVGICSVAIPTYINEISIPSNRGTMGVLYTLSLVGGILFTSCLGIGLYWRWISVICGSFSLIFFVAVLFVPESPYYLAKKSQLSLTSVFIQFIINAIALYESRLCIYSNHNVGIQIGRRMPRDR